MQIQEIDCLLERELHRTLEDPGIVRRRRNLTKGRGNETCRRGAEIGMVQHVEVFQSQRRIQPLVDREDARDLSVELVVGQSPERVPADISVGPVGSAG